jgi:hypothetical protein
VDLYRNLVQVFSFDLGHRIMLPEGDILKVQEHGFWGKIKGLWLMLIFWQMVLT